MSLDKITLTDKGLLNINRKIINDKKFSSNLIATVGDVSINSNIASRFSASSYMEKNELIFSGEPITIVFEGDYVTSPTNITETCYVLSGNGSSLIFQFINKTVNGENINCPQVILPSGNSITFDYLNFVDGTHFKSYTELTSNSCKVFIKLDNEIFSNHEPATFTVPIDLTSFNKLTVGSNPSNRDYFWEGSVNLNEFELRQNNETLYTPTTSYSLEFTKLVINDGKYPLGSTPNSIARHRYYYEIDQIARSDNTLLLTSILNDSAKLVIREIGLYAKVKNGTYQEEFLFGYIQNLNIDKGSEVPYDLILTVDIALNVVNVVGFPDASSFILNTIKPALLKNFISARNVNTYVIENLERIIRMNSLQPIKPVGYCYNPKTDEEVAVCTHPSQIQSIGYNTPQLVYRTQKAISEQQDCYSAIQTYSKLFKKLKRESYIQFNTSSIIEEGEPIVSEDGLVTGISTNNYVEPTLSLYPKDWTFDIAFSLEESSTTSRCILSMGNFTGELPNEEDDTEGVPYSYIPFVDIQINRYGKVVINGVLTDYTVSIGQKYNFKLIYQVSNQSLQVLDSNNTEIGIFGSRPQVLLNDIFLGIYGTYDVSGTYEASFISSNPLENGTLYLTECGFEQEDNNWITTEEVVTQPAQLIQQYHLPALSTYSYKTYDICNNPEYYIEYLDGTYQSNRDLIDFSSNLSLCLKIDLRELSSWVNVKGDNYKPILIVAKDNLQHSELFKIEITRDSSVDTSGNPLYLYNIAFILQTIEGPIKVVLDNISAIDFEQYVFTPFLFTITKNGNTINLYKNNTLIANSSTIQSGIPSYDNSYITNTLEGYVTGKYVKEIIVIEGAISSEQLYYITNLTDTNF